MDPTTYGRMVEHGGYATGGIVKRTGLVLVGESGPELAPFAPDGKVYWRAFDGAVGVPARLRR